MNKYETTFGEYLKWYLLDPQDSSNKTSEEIGKILAEASDNMGYPKTADNIAAYLGFWFAGDEINEQRGRLYLPTKTSVIVFVMEHFDDVIVVEDGFDYCGHTHEFEINKIKFSFESICEPFNDEEFIIH